MARGFTGFRSWLLGTIFLSLVWHSTWWQECVSKEEYLPHDDWGAKGNRKREDPNILFKGTTLRVSLKSLPSTGPHLLRFHRVPIMPHAGD